MYVKGSYEGIEHVRNSGGKYAFITVQNIIDYYNNLYPCDTMQLQGRFNSLFYAVALPENSPFK